MRRLAIVALLAFQAAPAVSAGDDPHSTAVPYFLPVSTLKVGVTVTKTFDMVAGKDNQDLVFTSSLVTDADQSKRLLADVSGGFASKKTVEIGLAANGTLSAVNGGSQGQMGLFVKNLAGFVASVASVAGWMPKAADAAKIEVEYKNEYPDLAVRRADLQKTIDALIARIILVDKGLLPPVAADGQATIPTADFRKERKEYLDLLKDQLALLRVEQSTIQTHFQTWMNRKRDERHSTYEAALPLTELLNERPTQRKQLTIDALRVACKDSPRMLELAEQAGIVVVREDLGSQYALPSAPAAEPNKSYRGVFYRLPRLVRFVFYQVAGETEAEPVAPVPIRAVTEYVVDEKSALGFLEFKKTRWSDASVQAAFSTTGALNKITNASESAATGVAGMMGQLPGTYLDALKQANDVAEQRGKLQLQGLDAQIATVDREKKLLETQIALAQTQAGQSAVTQLDDLKNRLALLKAQRDFADAAKGDVVADQVKDIELQTQIVRLQTALQHAQLELLKAREELARKQENHQ